MWVLQVTNKTQEKETFFLFTWKSRAVKGGVPAYLPTEQNCLAPAVLTKDSKLPIPHLVQIHASCFFHIISHILSGWARNLISSPTSLVQSSLPIKRQPSSPHLNYSWEPQGNYKHSCSRLLGTGREAAHWQWTLHTVWTSNLGVTGEVPKKEKQIMKS